MRHKTVVSLSASLSMLFFCASAFANHIALPPAPRIQFTPVGAQLDGDAIDDMLVAPSQMVQVRVAIDTLNLASIGSVTYVLDWDAAELDLLLPTDVGPANPFPNHSQTKLGIDSMAFSHQNTTDNFGVPIPSIPGGGFVYTLDVLNFTVLTRLDNNGEFDVRVSSAGVNTAIGFFEINADQQLEVQPVSAPEADSWVMLAIGVGLVCAFRKSEPAG
jgi:hypothetical protein